MAELKKGILGGFSGTVGTVVGANWRGKDIIRSRPKASSKMPTLAQMAQREKFKMISHFIQPIRSLHSRYFGEKTGTKSKVNLALSYFLTETIVENDGIFTIDYLKVLISKGELTGFTNLTLTRNLTQIDIEWADNSNQGTAKAEDKVSIAIYCETYKEWRVWEDVAIRSDSSISIQLPTHWDNEVIYCYAFLYQLLHKRVSTSVLIT